MYLQEQCSRRKCFPPPKNAECGDCTSNGDCESGICFNFKCVFDDQREKCFSLECEDCTSGQDCITQNCENNKCVFDTDASRELCLPPPPPPKLAECEPCANGVECVTDYCYNGKCATDTDAERGKCSSAECEECTAPGECYTKNCLKGKCTFRTPESRLLCSPPPPPPKYSECEACEDETEGESGICYDGQVCTESSLTEACTACACADGCGVMA